MSIEKHRYEWLGILGSGGHSDVYKGRDRKTGKLVALKAVLNWYFDDEGLEREGVRNMLRAGTHPNIIAFLGDFYDEIYHRAVFVFDGDLYSGLKGLGSFSEADVRDIIRGTLLGLLHLHKKRIIHRDIKPENILLKKSNPPLSVVVADFGLSSRVRPSTGQEPPFEICTLWYVPPEVVQSASGGRNADSWSVGIVMAELLLGHHPFLSRVNDLDNPGFKKMLEVWKWNPSDEYYKYIPSEAKDLLGKLLDRNHHKRFNVHDALQHRWFNTASKNLIFSADTLNEYPRPPRKFPKQINSGAEVEATRDSLSRMKLSDQRNGPNQSRQSNVGSSVHHTGSNKADAHQTSRKVGTGVEGSNHGAGTSRRR